MKNVVLSLLWIYKKTASPVFLALVGHGCRFGPTCSEYAQEAIERFGVIEGGKLAVKRIVRCHPLSKGYFDPVPKKLKIQKSKFRILNFEL